MSEQGGRAVWVLADGRRIEAALALGESLMEAARARGIPGILGECGGNLSCATCHVVVDPAWRAAAGTPGEFEDAMLDATMAPRRPGSRLSCQLRMSPALDGIVLQVPEV
ncbi:MAG: 2Fe-2S iron-sulfur cluster-binding protein [Gemmobacter sp.]